MAFDTLPAPLATPKRAAIRMEKFVIEGGYPLSGTVVPAGNKNAALPALAACLLTEEDVVLRNIPRIKDVEAMVGLLEGIGVRAEWRDDNVIALNAEHVLSQRVGLRPLAEEAPGFVSRDVHRTRQANGRGWTHRHEQRDQWPSVP